MTTELRDPTDPGSSAVFKWVNIAQIVRSTGYKKKQNKSKQTKAVPDKSKFPNVCFFHWAAHYTDMGRCSL